jgi:hypothetical protein
VFGEEFEEIGHIPDPTFPLQPFAEVNIIEPEGFI